MNVSKFCCPKCHLNEDISEYDLAWVEYTGKLDNNGFVDASDSEPLIRDNPDDPQTYYICNSCGEQFYEPEEITDELTTPPLYTDEGGERDARLRTTD